MPLLNPRAFAAAPLTMEERAASAAATIEAALVVFSDAASDFDAAADELGKLADEALNESNRFHSLRVELVTQRNTNRARALRIRETFAF